MQPKLVFVGVATHDTIALVDEFPDPDGRVVATELVQAGGGPAATAAVAAARLGHHVAFAGTVGDDAEGHAIRDGLLAEGVDVSSVTVDRGTRSAASVVIVDAGRSTRAIVNRPPVALHLSDRALEVLAGADWVHVDQAGWQPVHAWWAARTDRPRLSIDAGNPIEGFTPAGIDLYVPTISSLRRRHDLRDPRQLLERAIAEGARLVVATDGPHGSYALGTDHRGITTPLVHVPGRAGPVRSTLGAGDVFHGALLAAIGHDLDLTTALRYANVVAYRSCQGLDGRSAIPIHAEVLAELRSGTQPTNRHHNDHDPGREFRSA